jgi:hypothetical protein
MSNPSFDIASILEGNKIGTIGKDIFATKDVPPKPDLLTFVSTTGATGPDVTHIDYSFPVVQVVVRGATGGFLVCSNRMYAINKLLHGLNGIVVNGTRYTYIFNSFGPIELELDDNRRPSMATTFKMMASLNASYLNSYVTQVSEVGAILD